MVEGLILTSVVLAPALVYTTVGGYLHQRAGVVNIALEGLIVMGGLTGMLAADGLDSALGGIGVAVGAGALVGWAFTLVVSRLKGNEIIVGLGFNILMLGLAGLVLVQSFGTRASYRPEGYQRLPGFGLPFLEDVPFLGSLLARQDLVVWGMIPAVIAAVWVLSRTSWGLRLRAVGADATSSEHLGLSVYGIREQVGAVAGALSALAGAHLSIAVVGLFSAGMSAGRGYIALAAVYFAPRRLWLAVLAAFIFVVVDALQIRFQLRLPWLPVQLVQILPYLAVILALTFSKLTRKEPR
jgi:simple sugar transport system permease protein